jgi:tetratricopeptide (TPR) repeat protein
MQVEQYEKAVEEFKEASEIFRRNKMKMDEAKTHRFWGEALLLLRQYKEALKHENIYLKMAKEEKEFVEVQRAYASLGRAYLLKSEAENANDNNNEDISNNEDFKAAERAFLKGLLICKE